VAGNREAASRAPRNTEARRDQLVVLGSIVALGVALLIVAAGLYLAVYRPAREHVLTVGTKSYNTGDVERRALYILLYQQAIGPKSQSEVVSKTLEILEREEVIRTFAKDLVPEVTAQDITTELQALLVPTVTPEKPAPGVLATETPTPTPTATPTVDQGKYVKALQDRLARGKLTKPELDDLVSAGLYEDRLREKMKNDLPKSAPQVLLITARTADQATADQIRAIGLRPGVDFASVARSNSVANSLGIRGGSPTWVIVDLLDSAARDVVKNLKVGEISNVTKVGDYFEVYKVMEISADQEIGDAQKEQMVTEAELKWLDEGLKKLNPQRDLTPSREQWILNHVSADYVKATGTPRAK
jgi:hypothetical protein